MEFNHEIINQKKMDFMNELLELCSKYGYSISHEKMDGDFIIRREEDHLKSWMYYAIDHTPDGKKKIRAYVQKKKEELGLYWLDVNDVSLLMDLEHAITDGMIDCETEKEFDDYMICIIKLNAEKQRELH